MQASQKRSVSPPDAIFTRERQNCLKLHRGFFLSAVKWGQYHAGLALFRFVEIARRGQTEWTYTNSDFRNGKAVDKKSLKKFSDGDYAAAYCLAWVNAAASGRRQALGGATAD